MNAIFGVLITLSLIVLLFVDPSTVLPSFISGAENAFSLSVKLIASYAVWLGIFGVLEDTGLDKKFARLLKPVNRFLFGKLPEKAEEYASINISANILGLSGATTPFGIKTIDELEKFKDTGYQITMFFVINATSIQLIPTSVLALRISFGAATPFDIILPTVLSTAVSTLIGVLLVKIFVKK